MEFMSKAFTYDQIMALEKKHANFIIHDLVAKSFLTLFFVVAEESEEKYEAYDRYFEAFKTHDAKLYDRIRNKSLFAFPFILPRGLRRWAALVGYKEICKKTRWG